ncbi:MAG: hypothetical protein V5B78_11740, partial [Desulfohalobiaceae bacterium]
GLSGKEFLESWEIKELQKRLSVGLTSHERKKLHNVAKKIDDVVKNLSARPFVQIMSGSTAKSCAIQNKKRSFNIIYLSYESCSWKIESHRYIWDWEKNCFIDYPLKQYQFINKFP